MPEYQCLPKIPLSELTGPEADLVSAVLNGKLYHGKAIRFENLNLEIPIPTIQYLEGANAAANPADEGTYTRKSRRYVEGGSEIRGQVLADLASEAYGQLTSRSIRVKAIVVRDIINLGQKTGLPALMIKSSSLLGLNLSNSAIDYVELVSSEVGAVGLIANFTNLKTDFVCRSCAVSGEVRLRHINVTGQLDFSGSTCNSDFLGPHMVVGGSARFNNGFSAHSLFRISSSRIGGDLTLSDGAFLSDGKDCLNADSTEVKGCVYLVSGFTAMGKVSFHGASVGSQFNAQTAHFLHKGEDALRLDDITIGSSANLSHGFVSLGQVRLTGASITGNLDMTGAILLGTSEFGLIAFGTSVGKSIVLGNGFQSHGKVRVQNSTLGDSLICDYGMFLHPGADCLVAFGMKITNDLFLRNVSVAGWVDIRGSSVGGEFSLEEASISSPDLHSFHAENLVVLGNFVTNRQTDIRGRLLLCSASLSSTVFLDGFIGEVHLQDATIERTL